MTQQPGQGTGPNGPQGYPGGPSGPNPYGAQPPRPPQQPGPYGAPQNPYGQPPQPGAQPYGQPPQQPYGQPQYGTQPGAQPYGQPPQQPTRPQQPSGPQQPYGSQPSGFAAPQPNYGAQQPGPSPYGQAAGAWSPGGLPPAPPKKTSKAPLLILVGVLLVALVGSAAWFLTRPKTDTGTGTVTSAASTTSATKAASSAATKATTTAAGNKGTATAKTAGLSCSGSSIDSADYSATLPSGWTCDAKSGTLLMSTAKFDTVMVLTAPSSAGGAAKICAALGSTGTMTTLPDTQWGGKTAKTVDIASGSTKSNARCVDTDKGTYYVMGIPIGGSYADVVAGMDALTSSWTWK